MTTTVSWITAGTSGRRSDVPLDMADVLDLLAAAVDQRGGEFSLGFLAGAGIPHRIHRYANAGEPRCIVGHALSLAGVTGEDLDLMRDQSVRDLYRDGQLPIEITVGALIVLDAAQRSEARGRCWREVLDDAVSAIGKLLDLVHGLPDVKRSFGNCRQSCSDRAPARRNAAPTGHSRRRKAEAPDL